MPARPSHVPTYAERLGLQAVLTAKPIPFEVGSRIVVKMLEKGWIERATIGGKYRITEAGVEALRRKIP